MIDVLKFTAIVGGLLFVFGSLTSPALRENNRLLLWKAKDGGGRMALVGLPLFLVSAILLFIVGRGSG